MVEVVTSKARVQQSLFRVDTPELDVLAGPIGSVSETAEELSEACQSVSEVCQKLLEACQKNLFFCVLRGGFRTR